MSSHVTIATPAALSAALLAAAAGTASAQLIITPQNLTLAADPTLDPDAEPPVLPLTESFDIDIDGNGTTEAIFALESFDGAGGLEYDWTLEFVNGAFDISVEPDPDAFGAFTSASFEFTPVGSTIGGLDPTPGLVNGVAFSGESVRDLASVALTGTDLKGGIFNDDPIVDEGVLGVGFLIDGELHFGSILLGIEESFGDGGNGGDVAITVIETRYNATPGGELFIVPAPGAAAALALGAATGMRRSRRSA